jgi:hypothetical protein
VFLLQWEKRIFTVASLAGDHAGAAADREPSRHSQSSCSTAAAKA